MVPRLDHELFKWALECESAGGEGKGTGRGRAVGTVNQALSNEQSFQTKRIKWKVIRPKQAQPCMM